MSNLNVNMDFIGHGKAQGEIAAMLLANQKLDPLNMRPWIGSDGRSYVSVYAGGDRKDIKSYKSVPINTNATLRRDEWKSLDEAVLAISRTRLGGVQDLIDNNLVYNLGNAMGTTVLESHSISDAMEAALSMDAVTRSQGDRVNYETNYMPIPIIHVDYEINSRVLASSRSLGNPLDTDNAEAAARKVLEKLESMLFTNTTFAYGGGTIYSYLNEPNINTVTLSLAWDNASKTGSQIITDVLNMKQASINAKHYGPSWHLYIPTAYETKLDNDYDTTTPGTTIRERILKIQGINKVQVIDTLPANTVVLVQMTTDVVRLVQGMAMQNVEWRTEGKMVTNYKVMAIQVPQVRSDQSGNSGIVVLS